MKNMGVLIDTNVLLNYITNRKDIYLEQSIKIVELCAKEVGADYIITVNEKDFHNSEIPAINPADFLERIKSWKI